MDIMDYKENYERVSHASVELRVRLHCIAGDLRNKSREARRSGDPDVYAETLEFLEYAMEKHTEDLRKKG